MKRFAPLLLIVFALAAVPAAFADNTTPAAPAAPAAPTAAPQAGHPFLQMRLELLQLRLQLVQIRHRIACHKPDSDRCTQFTQKVVDRLTTFDKKVQAKLADLKCTADSTDERCDVLAKLDAKLQDAIKSLGSAPSPTTSSSNSSGDSGLDQAAGNLGQLAGSKP